MSHEVQAPRYLFAVDPDTSKILAKWKVESGESDERIISLTEACQAMVGDDFVILDTEKYASWLANVQTADDGVLP